MLSVDSLAAQAETTFDNLPERYQALEACLGELEDSKRQLLLRWYGAKESTRDVAQSLGRSYEATRKAIRQGMLLLIRPVTMRASGRCVARMM